MRSQVVLERAVTVRTFPEIVAINPNFTVAINTIEIDEDKLSFRPRREIKRLAIPTNPARKRSTASSSGTLLVEFSFDAPIMRQIQRAPLRIVESFILTIRNIAKMKTPICVECQFVLGS